MKNTLFICFIILLSTIHIQFSIAEEKNLPVVKRQPEKHDIETDLTLQLNTTETFTKIIPQKTIVFMVGNNQYPPHFSSLSYCINDCMLLKEVLIQCCKVEEKNISLYKNITLEDFRSRFPTFIQNIDKDSRIIIFYSGHGAKDGSLLFTDGQKLTPVELRSYINSFENDTIMILDTCYSGNNEGPLTIINLPFRTSSLRIYASLAHQTAKEVQYADMPYLQSILPFYKNVLNAGNIKGNSYFMSMFGYFFATYKLNNDENVSFQDIVSYITRECKNYMEYLAKKSEEEPELSVELNTREYQLPKLEPWYKDIVFTNSYHHFILLQKKERANNPDSNFLSLDFRGAAMFPAGISRDAVKTGISAGIGLSYNFFFSWGIPGFGISTELGYTSSVETDFSYSLIINPVTCNLRFITNFPIPFFLLADVHAGFIFQHINSNNRISGINLFLSPAIGAGYYLSKEIALYASLYYTMTFYKTGSLQSILPKIGIYYNFF